MAKRLSEDELKYIISAETSAAQQEIYKLSKATAGLKKEEQSRRKAMIELEAQGKKNTKEYKNLAREAENYKKQVKDNIDKENRLRRSLDVNAMSMNQLRKHYRELKRELDNTSRALEPNRYNKLNKELEIVGGKMSELSLSARSFKEILTSTGAFDMLTGNLFTDFLKLLGQGLKDMKEFAKEAIQLAEQADGVTHAFKQLGEPNLLASLRESTKGTVDDLELMKAAVQANNFRIPLQDLGKYLQFAQLKAQQTGQSVEYMTSSIITGLGRQSVQVLDNLGLSAAEINEEIKKTGSFMSGVGTIIDQELSKAGEAYSSASERAQASVVKLKNAQLDLGATLLPLKEEWTNSMTDIKVSLIELFSWSIKNRQVFIALTAAIVAYRSATLLSTKATSQGVIASKMSLLLHKAKAVAIAALKGATLLYAAAKAALTQNTTRAAAAMRLFNTVTKANPVGLLAAAVAAATTALFLFRKKSEESISINQEAVQSIAQEKNHLEALKKVLFDSSKSYDERKWALNEIQKIVPDYHAALTKEGKLINNNTEALDLYVRKMLIAAKQQAANTKYQEALHEQSEWINQQDPSTLIKVKEVEWSKNDPQNQGKSEEALAAMKGLSPTTYRSLKQKISVLNKQVADAEKLLTHYTQEMAKISTLPKTSSVPGPTTESDNPSNPTIQAEKAAIESLKKLRQEALEHQQKLYNAASYGYNADLAERLITKEQHEMLMLQLDKDHAKERLKIEQNYHQQVEAMDTAQAKIKEELIAESQKNLNDATKSVNDTELALTSKLGSLLSDFKNQFRVTTIDEDLQLQLATLEAAYQARLELAQKESIDTTALTDAYNRAREQLETDHQERLHALRSKYGLVTRQEQYDLELKQLQAARSQGLILEEEYAKAVAALKQKYETESFNTRQTYGLATQQELHQNEINQLRATKEQGLLTEEEHQTALTRLKVEHHKKQFDYFRELTATAVQSLQQAEQDNIDAKYDAEIQAAQGNAEEVERLEKEKAQKKLQVQKRYADINFAIKASQIIADTSVAIMKALAELGPIAGPIAAALMGVTGAAQLAAANAERQKVKNMTIGGTARSAAGARVASGREKGGKIDVTRAQDGKFFPQADYSPQARGYIDRPTVIVGEGPRGHSREWVASNAAVDNPTVAPILNILDRAQQAGTIRTLDLNAAIRARMAGYASGGSISPSAAPTTAGSLPTAPTTAGLSPQLMERLARAIVRIDEQGIPASVALTDIDRQRQLLDRSRSIASKI